MDGPYPTLHSFSVNVTVPFELWSSPWGSGPKIPSPGGASPDWKSCLAASVDNPAGETPYGERTN